MYVCTWHQVPYDFPQTNKEKGGTTSLKVLPKLLFVIIHLFFIQCRISKAAEMILLWKPLLKSTWKIVAYYIHYNVNGHTEKNNTMSQYHCLRQILHISCFQTSMFYSGIKTFHSLCVLRSLIKKKAQF